MGELIGVATSEKNGLMPKDKTDNEINLVNKSILLCRINGSKMFHLEAFAANANASTELLFIIENNSVKVVNLVSSSTTGLLKNLYYKVSGDNISVYIKNFTIYNYKVVIKDAGIKPIEATDFVESECTNIIVS